MKKNYPYIQIVELEGKIVYAFEGNFDDLVSRIEKGFNRKLTYAHLGGGDNRLYFEELEFKLTTMEKNIIYQYRHFE